MRYSIVIPTYNHLEDCLRPCLTSVLKATSGLLESGEAEVIIVANGCNDGTVEYLDALKSSSKGIKYITTPDPLGYTVATNIGIRLAVGEFVVLMNNDTQVLDWGFGGRWLEILNVPFSTNKKHLGITGVNVPVDTSKKRVGITGVKKIWSDEVKRPFVIFFLAMIERAVFSEIGYLDEIFNPGGGEDIDFCMRLEKAGYECVRVPEDGHDNEYTTNFPIYHVGGRTVHNEVPDWENEFRRHMRLLDFRAKHFFYSNFADVTCEISTLDRQFTTLPLAIMSVINQKLKPKKLLIFVDNYNAIDLRQHSIYLNLFAMLDASGIQWTVLPGQDAGQVENHQKALDIADTEYIWRLDDDNYAEPDVLEKLMRNFFVEVGAVGGSVLHPMNLNDNTDALASTNISDINTSANLQWTRGSGVVKTDHLYSTFVYRRIAGKHGYCKELSKVGHREETIFTHEMKREGWFLYIDRSAVTWHLRENTGGIRKLGQADMWAADEAVFQRKIQEWGVEHTNRRWINMDCGIGDNWMFKMILEQIMAKYAGDRITIATAHPDVFHDVRGVDVVSVAEGKVALGQERFDAMNVYAWCYNNEWDRNLIEAMKKLYLEGVVWEIK